MRLRSDARTKRKEAGKEVRERATNMGSAVVFFETFFHMRNEVVVNFAEKASEDTADQSSNTWILFWQLLQTQASPVSPVSPVCQCAPISTGCARSRPIISGTKLAAISVLGLGNRTIWVEIGICVRHHAQHPRKAEYPFLSWLIAPRNREDIRVENNKNSSQSFLSK